MILGSVSSSIEYRSEKDGSAIKKRVIAGTKVQMISSLVWWIKPERTVVLFSCP